MEQGALRPIDYLHDKKNKHNTQNEERKEKKSKKKTQHRT